MQNTPQPPETQVSDGTMLARAIYATVKREIELCLAEGVDYAEYRRRLDAMMDQITKGVDRG